MSETELLLQKIYNTLRATLELLGDDADDDSIGDAYDKVDRIVTELEINHNMGLTTDGEL